MEPLSFMVEDDGQNVILRARYSKSWRPFFKKENVSPSVTGPESLRLPRLEENQPVNVLQFRPM